MSDDGEPVDPNQHLYDEIRGLRSRVGQLQNELENVNDYTSRAENDNKELKADLEAKEAALITNQTALATAKSEIRAKDTTITTIEEQVAEAHTTNEELEATNRRLKQLLDDARAKEEEATQKCASIKTQKDGIVSDMRDTRRKFEKAEEELKDANAELASLRSDEQSFKEGKKELQEAKERIRSLAEETEKLKQDIKSLGFNASPSAYRKSGRSKTLEDELAGLGDSSSQHDAMSEDEGTGTGSESESTAPPGGFPKDSEQPGSGFSDSESESTAPPGGFPKNTEHPGSGFSDSEESNIGEFLSTPRQSRPKPKPEIRIEYVEKKKPVYINQTVSVPVYIDRPFQVFAHNPIVCWFQVELNFIILFFYWLSTSFDLLGRSSRKILGFKSHTSATDPGPFYSIDDPLTPTDAFQPESPADDPTEGLLTDTEQALYEKYVQNREKTVKDALTKIGPITPEELTTPNTGGSHFTDQDGPLPTHPAHPGNLIPATQLPAKYITDQTRPNVWTWRTILDPNPYNLPSVKNTLIGIAFHLLVYACVFMSYDAYNERSLWLAANDSTRIFVNELLQRSGESRSGLVRLFYVLPEEWKRGVDVFLWKQIVRPLGLQVSYKLPG
jgi:predicted  nucleic acid-binding Zn-ribbon protein